MRVDIYRNLNRAKQGLPEQWSIRHKGLVIGYTSAALLQDATTHVTPGAVEKIRQSGRKAVCAWVTGEWEPTAVLRTERQRGKEIPIYAEPDGVDYTEHAAYMTFNPRHANPSIAAFFYWWPSVHEGKIRTGDPITPKIDRFSYVYFLSDHTVKACHVTWGGGLGRGSC